MTQDRMAHGYEPNFDIDYKVGQQGELFVKRIVDSFGTSSVEVKTDERFATTGNVYLEMRCKYRGEWKQSGIEISPADFWCHVIADEVVVVAPTERVRQLARYFAGFGQHRKTCMRGSHPTAGVVIPLRQFVWHLAKGVPDEHRDALDRSA